MTAKRIERIQTGMRMEKRVVQVLKGLAAYYEIPLGDLVEGIVLHAFEGRVAFSDDSIERIAKLREVYGLDLTADDSHRLIED